MPSKGAKGNREWRVLCDTNIYGCILDDPAVNDITTALESNARICVCKFNPIREELRGKVKNTGRNAKVALPTLYDRVSRGSSYSETPAVRKLASDYLTAYRANGGHVGARKVMVDFKIVACASINQMDVVASKDQRTMLSAPAKKAYQDVNAQRANGIRTPEFWLYPRFRSEVLK